MYEHLNLQEDILSPASKIVAQFRGRSAQVYAIGEIFISEERLILGGDVGLSIILGQDLPLNNVWEVYSYKPYPDAKKLTEVLFAEGFEDVYLRTIIRNHELDIVVRGQTCFKFQGWSKYAGGSYLKGIGWYTGVEIMCVSTMFQLARVYQTLYSPGECGNWVSALETEAKLFNILPTSAVSTASIAPVPKLSKQIAKALSSILVGWSDTRTTIASDLSDGQIRRRLKKILGDNVVPKSEELGVFGDFRITRTNFVATGRKNHVVSVYNSTSYECIPAEELDDIYVAKSWVLLRFQALTCNISATLRESILKDTAINVFPRDLYFGYIEKQAVTRKKLTADDHRIKNYFPKIKKKKVEGDDDDDSID
jgi:hypothetical protein